ncbi:hypothetical protein Trydic_g321 [Trypoxylus dichotomus]
MAMRSSDVSDDNSVQRRLWITSVQPYRAVVDAHTESAAGRKLKRNPYSVDWRVGSAYKVRFEGLVWAAERWRREDILVLAKRGKFQCRAE